MLIDIEQGFGGWVLFGGEVVGVCGLFGGCWAWEVFGLIVIEAVVYWWGSGEGVCNPSC